MDRGDIWHVDLSPSAGREQRNPHYVLVVSPRAFNRAGVPIVCPITTVGTASRMRGFAVTLQGAGTSVTGVIQVDQIKAVDMGARRGRATGETVPDYIMDEVLAKLTPLVQ